jgi:glycosyltransferase involved in cell wall biosynthesis
VTTGEPLRLAVNAIPLRSPLTGIGQYTLQLFQAIARRGDVDARFFYGSHWSDAIVPAHSAAIDTVKQAVKRVLPYPYLVTRAAQSVVFARGVWRHRPHVYHEPNYMPLRFNGRVVATFHDLSVLHMPEAHPADRVTHWRRSLPDALARIDHYLTDSEFVRQELIGELKIEPARITTAHIGVADEYHPRDAQKTQPARQKYGLHHDGYLLAVGTLEPRKNLATALQAYAHLPHALQDAYPFVIAGKEGWRNEALTDTIDKLKAQGHLRFLGFVEQSDLPLLYSAARAFVYPSLYEGFGLPVAEALASGIPTVTTTASSLPEVAGDAALLVTPSDIDAMSEALAAVLDDALCRTRLRTAGPVQAKRFRWDDCAAKTVTVYRG